MALGPKVTLPLPYIDFLSLSELDEGTHFGKKIIFLFVKRLAIYLIYFVSYNVNDNDIAAGSYSKLDSLV